MGEGEFALIQKLFEDRFNRFEANVKEDITKLENTVASIAEKMVTEERLQSKMHSVKELRAQMAAFEQQERAKAAAYETKVQAQERRLSNLEAFVKGFTSVLKWGLGILTAIIVAVLIAVVMGWLRL